MKAVVLAAGRGSRLAPLTDVVPKCLVSVGGRPWLGYVLDNLRCAGVTEFGVVVGYQQELVRDYVLCEGFDDVTLLVQKEQKGTADALLAAREWCGNDNFLCVMGDGLWRIQDLCRIVGGRGNVAAVVEACEGWKSSVFLYDSCGRVYDLVEKPDLHDLRPCNIGVYRFTKEVWKYVESVECSVRGEFELTSAVRNLLLDGKLTLQRFSGRLSIGRYEDLPGVEACLKDFWLRY